MLIRGPQAAPSEGEAGDGRADAALVARICWYYFREGQTQDAIAQRLKMTRKRVNRILGDARESGFVQITIADPAGQRTELEEELIRKFSLRHAIVVPVPLGGTDVRSFIGAAAARYVARPYRPLVRSRSCAFATSTLSTYRWSWSLITRNRTSKYRLGTAVKLHVASTVITPFTILRICICPVLRTLT